MNESEVGGVGEIGWSEKASWKKEVKTDREDPETRSDSYAEA